MLGEFECFGHGLSGSFEHGLDMQVVYISRYIVYSVPRPYTLYVTGNCISGVCPC
jgi:hypothetical protein